MNEEFRKGFISAYACHHLFGTFFFNSHWIFSILRNVQTGFMAYATSYSTIPAFFVGR